MTLPTVVILASGAGSLAQALIDASKGPEPAFRIAAVLSDQPEAGALSRARQADLPAQALPFLLPRREWDQRLIAAVGNHAPWLVVSAGFMRLLAPEFLQRFSVINSHPSLLPGFPGAHAVADALAAGVSQTGCTIHQVDEGLDTGPVIRQERVEINESDTLDVLHERIKVVERKMLVDVVQGLARGEITLPQPLGERP
jgi:formyltetrahydrofolate-dependent phosphoribosylglycinamide formyltransferase